MENLLDVNQSVLFTGTTGVGKASVCLLLSDTMWCDPLLLPQSVIAKGQLNLLQEGGKYVSLLINFSAQTSSIRTQEIIESKLEKKRKTVLGVFGCHWYQCTVVHLPSILFGLFVSLLDRGGRGQELTPVYHCPSFGCVLGYFHLSFRVWETDAWQGVVDWDVIFGNILQQMMACYNFPCAFFLGQLYKCVSLHFFSKSQVLLLESAWPSLSMTSTCPSWIAMVPSLQSSSSGSTR